MRGGLGRTLLTAFLSLAIIPLGLLAFVTYHQIQEDARRKALNTLATVAELEQSHLVDWAAGYQHQLELMATNLDPTLPRSELDDRLKTWQAITAVDALLLFDTSTGQVLSASSPTWEAELAGLAGNLPDLGDGHLAVLPGSYQSMVALGRPIADGRLLALLLPAQALQALLGSADWQASELHTYLVTADGSITSSQSRTRLNVPSDGITRALRGGSGADAYVDTEGVPVFGAYRWEPVLQVAILAEQRQTDALAAGSRLAAAMVAIALGMALVTAASAAVVTRRVTQPIVQLTETAARMARGDLDQRVPVARQDEIGILARAFNRMASELRVLYGNLEAKVAERTRQLEEANEQARQHAIQLGISAEVARVATSIRDLDQLLGTVVGLIARAFELDRAAIWLIPAGEGGRDEQWLVWEATQASIESVSRQECPDPASRVAQAAARVEKQLGPLSATPGTAELAVPLEVHGQVLGILNLYSGRAGTFDSYQAVYQSLADQIGVAIENARAYGLERATVRRLQELDRIQSEFLTNMSHALRTPLTSVIGFSRLMLKELDGPLTDLQRADLSTIHDSGQQLLGLINDMLELSQLDIGTAPISYAKVDLAEVIDGVLTTVRALARTRDLQLIEEVPASLPTLHTDGRRVRQVILALLSNACKFTNQGTIWLRVHADSEQVVISVQDTGVGIPAAEHTRIFGQAQSAESPPGFSLAISKRVVEKLGGQIWLESDEGVGSTFTFTLPVQPNPVL